MHDYFYGREAEQFSFYRVPTALFTDTQYKDLSPEAKILYGILLKRMDLSAKNGWLDEMGRVYIIFRLEEIMEKLYPGELTRHDDWIIQSKGVRRIAEKRPATAALALWLELNKK